MSWMYPAIVMAQTLGGGLKVFGTKDYAVHFTGLTGTIKEVPL
jgi:hypothetical protein